MNPNTKYYSDSRCSVSVKQTYTISDDSGSQVDLVIQDDKVQIRRAADGVDRARSFVGPNFDVKYEHELTLSSAQAIMLARVLRDVLDPDQLDDCSACEGHPSMDNSPCALCGQVAKS